MLRAFLKGADGWCIRETTAAEDDPAAGLPQALVRNGRLCGGDGPIPSLRLKAVRRLQQDIEYLLLLQDQMGWTRGQLADFVQAMAPDVGDPFKMTGATGPPCASCVQEMLVKGE